MRRVRFAPRARRLRRAGYVLVWFAVVGVLWGTVAGAVPPTAAVGVLAVGAAAAGIRRYATPETRPRLLAGLAVLGVAVTVAVAALRPLAGLPLPDIGVFGRYTYLLTEVVFGGVAVALLVRAGRDAVRRAARTIVVLYPVAYVWDWYTLEVGVFEITMRTGIELVGIPLEEHLFALVVPALVLGVHETLVARDRPD